MRLHLNTALIIILMTKHPHMSFKEVQDFLKDVDDLSPQPLVP